MPQAIARSTATWHSMFLAAAMEATRFIIGSVGPGTRLPFLVISPWAKVNYVSHQRISLTSVVRFIEDNWLHGARIGGGSFDISAGSLMDMFDMASH